jgi:predicted nucleic acid-binding protein
VTSVKTMLDTKVLAELLRPGADGRVIAYVASLADPIISAIAIHELVFGVGLLPDGQRKARLGARIDELRLRFEDRTVPIDGEVARIAGNLRAAEVRAGFALDGMDALIAACAIVSSARLATRNTKDFERMGLDLVNPWTE